MEADEHVTISFFTVTILGWKKLLGHDEYKDNILQSLRFLCGDGRGKVYGFVLMPNHIHVLWRINLPHTLEADKGIF